MEQAVVFGEHKSLVGILTKSKGSTNKKDIGVICLNAGLLHRVGPFRMNVELASFLAKEGYSTLRFDCTSIGDSGASSGQLEYLEKVTQDVKQAVHHMGVLTGLQKFVVFGLCTGADNAHRAMLSEEKIVGGVFIDGYSYPSFKYKVIRYLPFLLSPKRVSLKLYRVVKFLIGKISGGQGPDQQAEVNPMFTWILPAKKKTEQELKLLISRGSKLFYIFTGSAQFDYNYKDQYFDSMPFLKQHKDQFTVLLNKETNHTFILYDDRKWLFAEVFKWLERIR